MRCSTMSTGKRKTESKNPSWATSSSQKVAEGVSAEPHGMRSTTTARTIIRTKQPHLGERLLADEQQPFASFVRTAATAAAPPRELNCSFRLGAAG